MQKTNNLKLWLTVIYVGCLMIGNTVAAKQIQLPLGLTATGAAVLVPITYILSDVLSEVYGYKWSRTSCYMAFALNLIMVTAYQLCIWAPHPDYFQNQAAFQLVLGNAPRVLVGSSLGLLAGDFVNDKVFQIMKRNHAHEHKGFAGRSIFSSVLGEIADTSVFVPIAFGGLMSIPDAVVLGASGVFLKLLCEVVLFPATNIACKKIKKAEGVDEFAKKG